MNLESFRRILELEKRQDFADKSVVDGLDRALVRLLTSLEKQINSRKKMADFHRFGNKFAPYANLEKPQRSLWLKGLDIFLDELQILLENPETDLAVEVNKTPPIQETVPTAAISSQMLNLPVTVIKGISESFSKKLAKLNIYTIYDMCTHFPIRHLDYSFLKKINQLQPGNEETIKATVWEVGIKKSAKGHSSTEAVLGDDSGNVRVLWFNNPFVAKNIKSGDEILISGRVNIIGGRPIFESPEWEKSEKAGTHTGRIIPVYALTAGLSQRTARKLFKEATETYHQCFTEFMPPSLLKRQKLVGLPQAILHSHYPHNLEAKEQSRQRLAFDELFILQMGALGRKKRWQESGLAPKIELSQELLERFVHSLPFEMTDAQKRVTQEILSDIQKSIPASRLVQGEVGSGKTVLAALALLLTAQDQKQGVFMAPTEVLAEQHFGSLKKLFKPLTKQITEETDNPYLCTLKGILDKPLKMALLTSQVKGKVRNQIYRQISDGTCQLLVGTHAVIQKEVEFDNLALAVIDEQHRFGVNQRQELRNKGGRPHVVAMTATPIPRTLSLTIYGDLDLSVVDQMPEGRQKVKTKWLSPEDHYKAYAFIQKQVTEGRQAFIICPLVEESETISAKAANSEYLHLSQNVFKGLRVGLMTGRLSGKEKDDVMQSFVQGELDILVSTAVVEVGIDVPNATVMLIESAERFGLAQLHQFRGRVGRGEHKSYCLLLSGEKLSADSQNRLRLIESTYDGFALAEEDLRMRGPGQFFGTRQSGIPELKMAKLSDVGILERARKEAEQLFRDDPQLIKIEHQPLSNEIRRVWQNIEDKLA